MSTPGTALPLARSTAAIVVAYKPDSALPQLLARLASQVGCILVVDNSAQGHPALQNPPSDQPITVLVNHNRGGLAGAYNLALDHLHTIPQRMVTHVVLLDEDSDPSNLGALLADAEVAALLRRDETAVVTPAYVDRATGLRGKYIQLQRWHLQFLPRVFSGLQPVAFVINSMSVWRLAAIERIGKFNEGLAIDHVDTEYCLRARAAGLGVHVHGSHQFLHAIGERKRFTFMGREMQAGGHPPQRRYLIGRNTAWLARRYLWREPAFAMLCTSRLGYEAVRILLAEDRRAAKLWALVRGAFTGLFGPTRR